MSQPVFSAERIAQLIAADPDRVLLPTPEQRAVIEHPLDGSVLVVAGAGSGKTETMANRVVWLIANGWVAADAVLGLTFTRKAAGELGERISARLTGFVQRLHDESERGALRPAEARRAIELAEELDGGFALPQTSTYDAFAAGIVQEFGPFAGVAPGLTLIDESMAWRLARETLLASTAPELLTSTRSTAQLVQAMLDLDHALADNQVSPAQAERIIAQFSDVLRLPYDERAATRGGSGKTYAPVRKAVDLVTETALVVQLAREYAQRKQQNGLVEFSDVLRLAQTVVECAPSAVTALRERTGALLLDEVQDTSVGQTRLLSRIFAGSPVMAVGDPHQSIYGWRGASAAGMTSFHRDFRSRSQKRKPSASDHSTSDASASDQSTADHTTLTLSVSWRNPVAVLDAANAISGPLRASSGVTVPALKPKSGAADSSIEWVFPETVHEERAQLAAWLRHAREEHLARTGALPTAAVLCRKRATMAGVAAALAEAGVPAQIVGVGGLLSTPEVVDIVTTLRCVWYADAGSELIRLLAGPRFRVGVADLGGLRHAARWFAQRDMTQQKLDAADRAADGVVLDPDREFTIVDALDEIAGMRHLDHAALSGITPLGRERLREAGLMLRQLRSLVGGGVPELIRATEHALRLDIELDASEHRGHHGASAARANLDLFTQLVDNFLAVDEQGTLAAVLEWLERASRDDQAAEHVPPPAPGTVQLITMHGAKGLEWDIVAVPRMVADEFPAAAREGSGWLRFGQLPDELRGDADARPQLNWRLASTQQELRDRMVEYADELAVRHDEEERRLAYVAITRSASRLLLTGSFWGGQKKPRGPSKFLHELQENGLISGLPRASAHDADPSEGAETTLTWPLDPLGRRRDAVTTAAHQVTQVLHADEQQLGEERQHAAERLDPTVELLLAERREAAELQGRTPAAPAAERLTASTFHEFIADPQRAERNRLRPLPVRPYRRTRLGNRFHEWIERRSSTARGTQLTLAGLDTEDIMSTTWEEAWDEASDRPFEGSGVDAEAAALAQLIERFEASRWAALQPIAVELEVTIPFAGRVVVCKLDAVYEHSVEGGADARADAEAGGSAVRYEIVDWKSGRAPRTERERAARFLQLDLYRHAYASWAGISPELIDVTLFYVAEGQEFRGTASHTLDELEQLWREAQAQLPGGAA